MVVKIGLVGFGEWGRHLARCFSELGVLSAICDSDPDRLKEALLKHDGLEFCTNVDELLQRDIDAVVIATPASDHYATTMKVLGVGKDVFVEKPMALEVSHGVRMVNEADKFKLVLAVGHVLEHHPCITELGRMVGRGDLGKILYVYSMRLNMGRVRTDTNVLWSFAPHDISVILSLLGEMPVWAYAHGGYYLNEDVADVTLTHLGFKSGVGVHIFVSWLHPFKENRLVVVGDKRMAVFDGVSNQLWLYENGQKRVVPVSGEEPLMLECRDFMESIKTRRKPKVDGEKGLQVLRVLAMCEKSLERTKYGLLTRNGYIG